MKAFLSFILFISFAFVGFAQQKMDTIVPDDYPIPDSLFNHGWVKIQSGECITNSSNWYTNDTLNETLYFEIYTDNWHEAVLDFLNNDIPVDIIRAIGLWKEDGNEANEKLKQKDLPGFIKQAKRINRNYFISNKGFKLGDNDKQAYKLYGKPDSVKTIDGYKVCYWAFIGNEDEAEVNKTTSKKPLSYGFGYSVKMYFRNEQLVAIILGNEIP